APPRHWRHAMPGDRDPTADQSRRPTPDELPCAPSDQLPGRRLSASTDGENACVDRTRSRPPLRPVPVRQPLCPVALLRGGIGRGRLLARPKRQAATVAYRRGVPEYGA